MSPGKSKSTKLDSMDREKPAKTKFPTESDNTTLYNDSRFTP